MKDTHWAITYRFHSFLSNIIRSTKIYLKLFFFVTFEIQLKSFRNILPNFSSKLKFSPSIILIFEFLSIFLATQAQVWCPDFLWSSSGTDYCCRVIFDNPYIWLKFLKENGVKIRFYFFPRADYSSIVEQNSLPVLGVFNVNLWLSKNILLYSKLNQINSYESYFTKSTRYSWDNYFCLVCNHVFWVLGISAKKIQRKFLGPSAFISGKKYRKIV